MKSPRLPNQGSGSWTEPGGPGVSVDRPGSPYRDRPCGYPTCHPGDPCTPLAPNPGDQALAQGDEEMP